MTNEKWLKWATARYFREHGFKVNMHHVKMGNAAVDGEVLGVGWKMALEIKSGHDDVVRGLGQIAEAKAFGYQSAALVTSLRYAKRIQPQIFNRLGLVLLGVDSRGHVYQVYP
jgi:hypothetical protein